MRPTGRRGPPGASGIDGIDGAVGEQGPQGLQGPIGLTGPQGIQGIPGPKGDTGNTGLAGTNGTNGTNGSDGVANLSLVWPVGSIYLSIVATNPATLFGIGTWVAFGAGRVPVGIDAGQAEFDTVEETGGAKTHTLTTPEIPSHTHVQDSHTHTIPVGATDDTSAPFDRADAGSNTAGANATTATGGTVATNQNAGGGGAHNNLQPYIVVYMWKRTA